VSFWVYSVAGREGDGLLLKPSCWSVFQSGELRDFVGILCCP